MSKSILRSSLILGLIAGHTLGFLLAGPTARAVSAPAQLVISELQTNGGTGHSGNELIELYNPGDLDLALDGWSVQYHSASNADCTAWNKTPKIAMTSPMTIRSHGYFLIAATGYLAAADLRFSAGLSDSAGAIRLVRTDGSVADTVAWGTNTLCGEGTAAPAPSSGRSLERRPGADAPTGGNGIDTDSNTDDFVLRTAAEPQDTTAATEDPATTQSTAAEPLVYLPLKLSELLIDPVSPQTDANDEFIELSNPNTEPINIGGYALRTPTGQYHLQPQVIPAGGYVIITSSTATISLSNTGGNIQLLDPAGGEIDTSAPWPAAVPGATWASFPDGWAWTTTLTPGASNLETDPTVMNQSPSVSEAPVAGIAGVTYLPLQINELFIDPSSPKSDAADEFIELYNPNDEPVDTAGYMLKSGTSLGNDVALSHHVIEAHAYLALMSSETGLPLGNSGSTVALFDPAVQPIGRSVTYGAAKPGLSYELSADGTWQWSTTVTPGEANVITVPVVITKTVAKSTAKPKTSPKIKAVKIKATPKPKATKKVAAKTTKTSAFVPAALHPTSGRTLLLVLLSLTICYVIYEFRYDLRHYYHRLRGHTKPRPKA